MTKSMIMWDAHSCSFEFFVLSLNFFQLCGLLIQLRLYTLIPSTCSDYEYMLERRGDDLL